MQSLFILTLHGERAVNVRTPAGESVAPTHARATPELARLAAAAPPGTWLAWYDERLEPYLSAPGAWPALAQQPLELLHLGPFQRTDLMAGSLGLVDFSSPYLLSGPTDCRFTTWLVSPAAGVVRADLLRACGFDGRLRSFTLALFDAAYRGMARGLCPHSEPRLLATPPPPDAWATLRRDLTHAETAVLIRRMLGRKWVLFWLLGRAIFHRRLHPCAGLRGLLAGKPPAMAPEGFRRLHLEVMSAGLAPQGSEPLPADAHTHPSTSASAR
jgi:hypothetical protein